jgi:hypothetical protein
MIKRDPVTGKWYEESPWTALRTPTAVYEGPYIPKKDRPPIDPKADKR